MTKKKRFIKPERRRRRRSRGRGDEAIASPGVQAASAAATVGDFVAKEAVFRAVLRQMRGGTPVSMETAAEVSEASRGKSLSRRKQD